MVLDPKRRARWSGLLPAALVGSLLLGPAAPVAGQEREPDKPATYSACVGSATESSGFGDVARSSAAARAAIDCLAHYNITHGTPDGDFDPGGKVTRWQMALFLVRAAGPAGIVLPRAADQGFGDIGGLAGDIRDAINQLADLEITKGITKSSFAPQRSVTRRQMAQFLARFLEAAPVGPGGADIEDVKIDEQDEYFEDLRYVPRGVHQVVATLFEMGVTTGTSDTRFSPDDPVTRAQMALFIIRALAHTNARPAGLALQAAATTVTTGDATEVAISMRDGSHRPLPDATVDMFFASSRKEAFDSTGRCSHRVGADIGAVLCEIDVNDGTTDGDGNAIFDLNVSEDLVMWAWAGDLFDRFDLDTTDYVSVDFGTVKPATHFLVTDDLHPEATKVPYGRSVRFSFQLVDADREPVAQDDVEIEIRIEEERGTVPGRPSTRTYFTDSEGAVEFSHLVRDPGPRDNNDDTSLSIEVLDSSDLELIDESADGVVGDDDTMRKPLPWSSQESMPSALVIDLPGEYHQAGSTGRGGRNRVVATLVDQYGEPVRGKEVHFKSLDENGLGSDPNDPNLAKPDHRDMTNVRGEATVRYYRRSADAGIETIEAFVPNDPGVPQVEREHYWVQDAPTGQLLPFYEVKVHDEDRNTLVIERPGNGPYVVTYDADDHFSFLGEGETFESFKKNLVEGGMVDVSVQFHTPRATNFFERKQ